MGRMRFCHPTGLTESEFDGRVLSPRVSPFGLAFLPMTGSNFGDAGESRGWAAS